MLLLAAAPATQFHVSPRRSLPCRFSTRRARPLCHLQPPTAGPEVSAPRRREVILTPLLVLGASLVRSAVAAPAYAPPENPPAASDPAAVEVEEAVEAAADMAAEVTSRIYDATVIGEPAAVGKDKTKVWEKLSGARVVYLGEAELVPVRDDKELELEIVKILRGRCAELQRGVSVALEAFPSNLQEPLNQFLDGRIDGDTLKSYTTYWPTQRWQEYEPILNYCRDNGVRLVACGTPPEILRTVQAEGIYGLSQEDRKVYAPPAGSGFISGFTSISHRSSVDLVSSDQSSSFGPCSYLSAQARVVDEYSMSQVILHNVLDGGTFEMLIVVTGASHILYGNRGVGIPARVSKKLPKKSQSVILLNPERQDIRREGEVPIADFLWYSAARPCSRNCFDRAEIARVMNAAGKRREALPQDLQKGLDLGLVSPEVLQNFFDLEKYPLLAELTHRFQGFRERLLADPKFLQRLAIEETISITTTLLAQYERRKENFFEELDYVITDTLRGTVVDFFTVWLPAPTISYLSYTDQVTGSENFEFWKSILGSVPDNAFQETVAGKNWNLSHRVASVLIGGLKLSGVGFVSSIGAVAASNILYAVRKVLNPVVVVNEKHKRSPILKTAVVYSGFLGTSANLRYQIISGLVEHRVSDHLLSSQPLLANLLSFIVRTVNSYWGTQQWVDLARFTGLQMRKDAVPTNQISVSPDSSLECQISEATITIDEVLSQSGENTTS